MTANAFGVAHCTISVVFRKVCDIISSVLGANYIKALPTVQEMKELIDGIGNKYGFLQAFGWVDGTHIPIVQPCENPHDYFRYKLKYALNVQGVCYWKGLFLDVDIKWPGSVHDGRVFANSRLNRLLREERLPNVIGLDRLKMHQTGFIHLTVPKELMWGILSHPTTTNTFLTDFMFIISSVAYTSV